MKNEEVKHICFMIYETSERKKENEENNKLWRTKVLHRAEKLTRRPSVVEAR